MSAYKALKYCSGIRKERGVITNQKWIIVLSEAKGGYNHACGTLNHETMNVLLSVLKKVVGYHCLILSRNGGEYTKFLQY